MAEVHAGEESGDAELGDRSEDDTVIRGDSDGPGNGSVSTSIFMLASW